MTTETAKKDHDNRLLIPLSDYLARMHPDFEYVEDGGDIEKIASILGQNETNNVLYVGPSGIGKTANLLGIAYKKKMALEHPETAGESGLPLHMIGRRFLVLDVNKLFDTDDDAKIKNDIEKIFTELEKPGDHVLVIEDANDFLNGIRDHQCHGLISRFMRELKNREFQTLWMVREEAGRNKLQEVLTCHSEVEELFAVLPKEPPPKEEVLDIVKGRKKKLQEHYDGIEITDKAVETLVDLTYAHPSLRIYMREQPARSMKMLDQMVSTFVSRSQTRSPEMAAVETELEQIDEKLKKATDKDKTTLEERRVSLVDQQDHLKDEWNKKAKTLFELYRVMKDTETELDKAVFDRDTNLEKLKVTLTQELGREATTQELETRKTKDIRENEQDIRELHAHLEKKVVPAIKEAKGSHNVQLVMDDAEVKKQFEEQTGIPVSDQNKSQLERVKSLHTRLKDQIYGQDHVVDIVAAAVRKAKAGLKNPKQPILGAVLFGTSGVGKTYLGECLAAEMFDDAGKVTSIDMSEFMDKSAVTKFTGPPPGLVGYDEGGRLTNAVYDDPYQVIILDEIEKAHPDVFKILLQVLDKGRLTDGKGRTVDFGNTVILMTTNLSSDKFLSGEINPDNEDKTKEQLVDSLKRFGFSQELINRTDALLGFKMLADESIKKVLRREIKTLNKQLVDKNMTIELPEDSIAAIVTDKYKVEEGARQCQKFLANKLATQIADIVLENMGSNAGGTIKARYLPNDTKGFALDFEPTNPAATLAAQNDNVQSANKNAFAGAALNV